MGWGEDISAAQKRITQKVSAFKRKVALDVFSEIVQRTPVDTGRARGNWQLTVGQPSNAVLATEDKTGAGAIQDAVRTVQPSQLEDPIWISNNLPYIGVLEYGRDNGKPGSQQAPFGMVRIVVAKWDNFLRSNRNVLE